MAARLLQPGDEPGGVGYATPIVGVYSRIVESRSGQSPPGDGQESGEAEPTAALGDVVTNLGGRIQEIVDTAERVVEEIRAEAEAAAQEYLDARRREADRVMEGRLREFGAVTRDLSARIERLRGDADALNDALGEAQSGLDRLAETSAPEASESGTSVPEEGVVDDPVEVEPPPAQSLRAARPEPSPPRVPAGRVERIPEEAILRATQMAVAGIERTQIELMLRTEYGLSHPASVVDQMLKSERA
jgi:hypothetical protein